MTALDKTATDAEKKRGALRRRKTLVAWSFILPNLVGFFVFTFVPIVFSLFLSLCEWSAGKTGLKFVGLDNFKYMLTQDRSFRIALKNSLYYTVVPCLSIHFPRISL